MLDIFLNCRLHHACTNVTNQRVRNLIPIFEIVDSLLIIAPKENLMELMNQPFSGQLGNRLIEFLESPDYHSLNIFVAFAKNSGVLRIKNFLNKFRKRGGVVNAYVGVDLGGTSYEALTALLLCTDSLNIVHSETSQTFHPKIYQFLGNNNGVIVIGSHNLTSGGLWTNFESSLIIPFENSTPNATQLLTGINDYISNLTALKQSFMYEISQSDVDKLLQYGYILNEVSQQVRQEESSKRDSSYKGLFGNGIPAKLPRVTVPETNNVSPVPQASQFITSVTMSNEGQTIWFETKRMTGGSRNILDLSMKSLVSRGHIKGTPFDLGNPKFMRGAVEFFGLNHEENHKEKDIILNYDGVDYSGNKILFPSGKKSNGTWRLQIKGVSSNSEKITEAFRKKGTKSYLVNKIITFTKICKDYYFLSIFPESDIEIFKNASAILARNGLTNNAKELGIIQNTLIHS